MSGQTTKQLIGELLEADLGKRHFSKWTAKEQQEAIRRCGLSSSQFGNKSERIAILTHLHSTPLPTEHLCVLRLIADLGLPPSGARSKQQFVHYLLCFMCEKLKFPPWEPLPVLEIVRPSVSDMCISARKLCDERMPARTTKPHFYRRDETTGLLWSERRDAWDIFMESGLPGFLEAVGNEYCKHMNLVLAHSPKCKPADLRVDIDDAQFKVDRVIAPRMFVEAWNSTGAKDIVSFHLREWRWGLGHLLAATKHAVAQAVRNQVNDDVQDESVYVGDSVSVCLPPLSPLYSHNHAHTVQADARHAYYCVGAVWRSVHRYFSSSARISDVISQMFVDKVSAEKLGLPSEEVSSR